MTIQNIFNECHFKYLKLTKNYLNNPINIGNVETSGSHVCAEKNARFSIAKLEKCGRAFSLLLFALKFKNLDAKIFESINLTFNVHFPTKIG